MDHAYRHEPTLPTGVSPQQAGRAWAWVWLQGKRNHEAAKRRRALPETEYGSSITEIVVKLFAPWKIEEYPGPSRYIAAVCGVAWSTARGWFYGKPLPLKHARRLLSMVELRTAEGLELAEKLRTYIAETEASRKPAGFAARRGRGGKTG